MKIYLLITTIAAFYCCSCNKELDNGVIDSSSFYIKAAFDGQVKTFNDNPSAGEYSGDLSAGFNMRADDNKSASEFSLNIIHPFGTMMTTGEYGALADGYLPTAHYRLGDVISYESGFDINNSTIRIVISTITATKVSGTFSGVLINPRDSSSKMTITNGNFNLPVHK